MKENRIVQRVEWGDCDAADIVFYPHYFRWFDRATAALFESVGLPVRKLSETYGVLGIPLVDASASFRSPSTYGDDIEIFTHIREWRSKTFVIGHRIMNGDRLAVEGQEIRVWAEKHPTEVGRIKAKTIPEELKKLLPAGE
jgi:4-hydroxybenzoyl-CoA thioesterase